VKVGIISVFTDYHRMGAHNRGALQPQVGRLIAALLPPGTEIDIVNDVWEDPDWSRDYDLVFLSCLHSDFDRARQISHYWRRRGAKTVLGGTMASTYTTLCAPYFDAIAVGDPESIVQRIVDDFGRGELKPVYVASAFDARRVPHPRLDIAARKQVLPLAVEATRGCPFTCEFCALTGIGTRFQVRSANLVAAEIAAGQRSLTGLVPWWLRHIAIFYDNNLGGNPTHMRELCDAFAPLGIRWGVCVTFNVICDPRNLEALAKGGCRCVFVGLETFNPETLLHMGKRQNVIEETRAAVELCHEHGILVMAGLMLSPSTDSIDYIDSIPQHLREIGLHVPTYVCFETPFPGTPHFKKLAASGEGAFLPNTLLRDLNGYTLAVPPKQASAGDFVAAYKRLYHTVYSRRSRLRKFLSDVPRFARSGYVVPILFDLYELFSEGVSLNEERNFLAGLDIEPPEARAVPLAESDFQSEEEYERIMQPWRVSDERGRALPMWGGARPLYGPKGRVNAAVCSLVSPDIPLPETPLAVLSGHGAVAAR
jgi:hypothetical protein